MEIQCEILQKNMWLSYLHLAAKRHLIIFKYDDVIDILVAPGTCA